MSLPATPCSVGVFAAYLTGRTTGPVEELDGAGRTTGPDDDDDDDEDEAGFEAADAASCASSACQT